MSEDKNKDLMVISRELEKILISGDLNRLTEDQRIVYRKKVCEAVGLNHLTNPLGFVKLNGKFVLYAYRDATDQLRKIHSVSITITARERMDDIYVVTAQAKTPSGRSDEATGAVNLKGKSGDELANLFMKAETKAKRRVTLSICGLGLLDESEVETIKDVTPPSPASLPEKPPHINGTQWAQLVELARTQGWDGRDLSQKCIEIKPSYKAPRDLTQAEFQEICSFVRNNPMGEI